MVNDRIVFGKSLALMRFCNRGYCDITFIWRISFETVDKLLLESELIWQIEGTSTFFPWNVSIVMGQKRCFSCEMRLSHSYLVGIIKIRKMLRSAHFDRSKLLHKCTATVRTHKWCTSRDTYFNFKSIQTGHASLLLHCIHFQLFTKLMRMCSLATRRMNFSSCLFKII